jgi:RimJ/RimL family protein N-acetyltransferase
MHSLPALTVREMAESDIELITRYWTTVPADYLTAMGVDINKMPSPGQWPVLLSEQLSQPYHQKQSYCIIWLLNGKPVGHCNVNKIKCGVGAYMHLHIWYREFRKKGYGFEFLKLTVPYFFMNLALKNLYCEPLALNPAPNKTLQKLGFTYEKNYITIPGYLNFEQEVSRWKLSREKIYTLPR